MTFSIITFLREKLTYLGLAMFDIGAIPGGWELAARATGETGRVAKGILAFVRQ